ncbi:transposon ty3-i Gag-Pol polyprotein [Plakobranchus ocellatus]|uniref:Transposon ty3-i Gag-Pol polyprotein n=1 Tax=Plakobranchus ocellatus TaxID=259542 RepID=A0AAV4C8V9_9GAST|nr:transposon ty3-i Gag-Pol polyprotein [Plakobranchus ocellatus]
MRLLRINFEAVHVSKKSSAVADALSRQSVAHTAADEEMETESYAVSTQLQAYQKVQGELPLIDGLLVYRKRISVPANQRQHILGKLHESHQENHKCQERALLSVSWPGLPRDLKDYINKRRECEENGRAQRNEPLCLTELHERPWQKLGADILTHQEKSETVTGKFRDIFKTHGIPDIIVSDYQPFLCRQFRDFAEKFSFTQQASAQAESAVKIAKRILILTEPDIELLNYRATAHSRTRGQSR